MLNRVKAIVFDFDGVIVESNDIKTDAFEHTFSEFPEHADAMMAFHSANIPTSRSEKFALLMKAMERQDDNELRQHLHRRFSAFVVERIVAAPLVPGAIELLEFLNGRIPVDLASVTPEEELHSILAEMNLTRFFGVAYGCPPWSKAEALKDVAAKRAISVYEILLVGDSSGDQKAASSAGTQFLGRNSGLPFELPQPRMCKDLFGARALIEQML